MFAHTMYYHSSAKPAHPVRTRLYILAFIAVIAATYTLEKRVEIAQSHIEIDYN